MAEGLQRGDFLENFALRFEVVHFLTVLTLNILSRRAVRLMKGTDMNSMFRTLPVLGLLCAVAAFGADDAAGWRSLFDGKTIEGWEVKSGIATYRVEDGAIVGKTEEGSPNSFLCTKEQFADFELTFEVLLDNNELNSGVQIRSQLKGELHGGRVNGPQVEIEASPGQSGFIYGEAAGGWLSKEPESKDPKVSTHSHFKNGEWNKYRILAVGPRIQVWINDQAVADLTTDEKFHQTYAKGILGLQVHGIGKKAGPFQVRWRNIKIREIK